MPGQITAMLLAGMLVFSEAGSADVLAAGSKKNPDTEKLHLEYSFGTPKFETATYGYQVLLDHASGINDAGMPDLPARTVSILLPKGKTVQSVKVTKGRIRTYQDLLVSPSSGIDKISGYGNPEETILNEEEPADWELSSKGEAAAASQPSSVEEESADLEQSSEEKDAAASDMSAKEEETAASGKPSEEETAAASEPSAKEEAPAVSEKRFGEETSADSAKAQNEEPAADLQQGFVTEQDKVNGQTAEQENGTADQGISRQEEAKLPAEEKKAEQTAEVLDQSGKSRDEKEIKARKVSDQISLADAEVFNQSVYTGKKTYPAVSHTEGCVQTVRGFSVYTITLYPMTYSGKTLKYAQDMTLDVTLKNDSKKADYIPTKEDLRFLPDDVENSRFGSTYFESASKAASGSTIAGKGKIDYIIITSKALAKTFQKLADHKESKGLRSAVVTTESICKQYGGYDKAEQIRNFIKDAYSKNRVSYVLLGGDGDNKTGSAKAVVPTRLLYCKPVAQGEKATMIASDLYYSCLDGTFDDNQNHIYGEETDGENGADVDLRADVYVGRAPVDTKKEAQNFIKKTIRYETRAKEAKALMVGEQLNGNISCPVEMASRLQDEMDADTLSDTIRRLRDEKLKEEYVYLYYDANVFVKSVLLDHLSLLGETVSLLTEYQPVIDEYVRTGTTSRKVTMEDILCLQNYCSKLSDAIADSPKAYDKKQKLMEELSKFRTYLSTCENMTYAEMFEKSDLFAGAFSNTSAGDYQKLDGIYGKTYKEEIRLGARSNELTTRGIPSTYTVQTLYDMDHVWTQQEVMALLNDSPEMVNHLGHADTDSLMKLSVDQIKKLSNKQAFFFYSQGCFDGSFDNKKPNGKYSGKDSIAEELLVASAKSGAFACVVNSRYGWYNADPGSTKGPSQIFDRLFWDEALYGKNKSLGAILVNSRERKGASDGLKNSTYGAVLRYCCYELNLLGDPETKLQDFNDPNLPQTSLQVKKSGTKRKLSWGKVSGAAKYLIYRSDSKNGTYKKIGETGSLQYKDDSADGSKVYYYKVAAYKKVSKVKYYRYSKPVKSGR